MSTPARVGVAIVGHGRTATLLRDAAAGILRDGSLDDVVAIDAGEGETPDLGALMCSVLDAQDAGRGVLMLVDLVGASPCQCARRNAVGHEDVVVVAGLNLAMLLKLARLDRAAMSAHELAEACAESGRRAVTILAAPLPSVREAIG